MVQVGVTAMATLCAVLLGGWLTVRAQDRIWKRDTERQWRDIRLRAYADFVGAFREFVAFVLVPSAVVTAVPRQRGQGDLMPFFDESGTRYKEHLEVTKTSVRLVSGSSQVIAAVNAMVRHARLVAASRADHSAAAIPAERFEALWAAERDFVRAARAELGLGRASDVGSGSFAEDSPSSSQTQ